MKTFPACALCEQEGKKRCGHAPVYSTSLPRARACEEESLPTLPQLVAKAIVLYDMALERTFDKNGEERAMPDTHSACKALELTAKLCGYLGDGRTMDKATLERELDRMGYELKPKLKRAG